MTRKRHPVPCLVALQTQCTPQQMKKQNKNDHVFMQFYCSRVVLATRQKATQPFL